MIVEQGAAPESYATPLHCAGGDLGADHGNGVREENSFIQEAQNVGWSNAASAKRLVIRQVFEKQY